MLRLQNRAGQRHHLWLVLLMATTIFVCVNSEPVPVTTASMNNVALNAPSDNEASAALKGKLLFAHVIYRHGDRMPIDPYPNDPWKDPKNWPAGWGQLTNIGKDQHYHLGQWLRKRYDGILNRTYSEKEIYVRSTDVDRTLMSALSNLAGLYPPTEEQTWNKDIPWQPIPVHTVPEKMDNVLAAKMPCAAYDYALYALLDSPTFRKINARFAYLYNYLTKYTGRTINSIETATRINDTLFIESLYNKTLPEWTKKVYPSDDMTYISGLYFAINTYTRQMARLKAGPLIKEILERFTNKMRGALNPDRSVWIYSAHDTTVASVLNALKLFNMKSPGYTACILIELRVNEKQEPFVSIFYKNTTADPLPLEIPGCGTACPLKKMYTLYMDILPTDWEHECKLNTMMLTYEEADIGMATGILVIIIVFMLLLSYVVMIYYRRRNYNFYAYSQVA